MERELTELNYRLYHLLGEMKGMGFNALKKPAALQFRHNNSDGFVAGYEKEEMDKYLCEVYKVIVELKSDLDDLRDDKKLTDSILSERNVEIAELKGDWNDVSNTTIPLNQEIFALLQDRTYSEKLRPATIVAKMMPAKRLLWTKQTEGNVLCYDVPDGNFHNCNGEHIKYWKYVNAPAELIAIKRERKNDQVKQAFTEMFETSIKSVVNESLSTIETACVTALDKFCQQMDSSAYDEQ